MQYDKEALRIKSDVRHNINLWLLSICFTVFTFIAAINPTILKENFLLSLQLTLSIPLFMTSVFARAKLAHTDHVKMWEEYGYATFIIAYSFLINVVGILLSILVTKEIAVIFFVTNILCALLYSVIEVIDDQSKWMSRVYKDVFFTFTLITLGMLPCLGIF